MRPTGCNNLWFINNPLAHHVSGIIMPIFRSARPCVWFSALEVLAGVFGSRETGREHCVHTDRPTHLRVATPTALSRLHCPKYINISTRSTHLFLFHRSSSSSIFSRLRDDGKFSIFISHPPAMGLFVSQVPPTRLALSLYEDAVWGALRVPYLFFSYTRR